MGMSTNFLYVRTATVICLCIYALCSALPKGTYSCYLKFITDMTNIFTQCCSKNINVMPLEMRGRNIILHRGLVSELYGDPGLEAEKLFSPIMATDYGYLGNFRQIKI